jgi:transposase InsO family protein
MDLGEHAHRVKFMIRDRGSNYTAAFDAVLTDAGIRRVLCNIRTPRMNAMAERWIGDAAASSWTAPSSGTRPICGRSCASMRPTTAATGRTAP